ncbi:MAG: hypothetical protein KatS3mg026_0972 [Bacteroidia bacterium]|nr:MAG: hypothetical protein KatS3mg026_0972 [Bacteroidia bacterium]
MSLAEKLNQELRTYALLASNVEILTWDQEVCMPKAGVAHRAALVGTLMELLHQRLTTTLLPLLREARDSSAFSPEEQRQIQTLIEEAEPAEKVPPSLVRAFSEAASLAQVAWVEARSKADFSSFAPHLEKLITLAREKAAALGYEKEPYEALLRLYEKKPLPWRGRDPLCRDKAFPDRDPAGVRFA